MEPHNPNTFVGDQPEYLPTSEERTMAILSHVLALFTILGPLIIYLIKKEESSYVAEQAKESLNFQITLFLLAMISIPLIFAFGLGIILLMGIGILNLVCIILASIKASDNKLYRYPINFRIIK